MPRYSQFRGGGDDSTGGVTDLPTKVYIREGTWVCEEDGCSTEYGEAYLYNGDGDVIVALRSDKGEGDRDTLSVGTIKNGKISLELPELSDDYFEEGETIIYEEDTRFYADIPCVGSCLLLLQTLNEKGTGMFFYSSKAQKVPMKILSSIKDGEEDEVDKLVEINLSKGWNTVYITEGYTSTDPKVIKDELQWIARCRIRD